MKKRLISAVAVAMLSIAVASHAQSPSTAPPTNQVKAQEAQRLPPGTTIPLKDGGRIVIDKSGNTYHQDAAGNRVRMHDGVTMEGADGSRYTMKNDAVWRTITERGTLSGK